MKAVVLSVLALTVVALCGVATATEPCDHRWTLGGLVPGISEDQVRSSIGNDAFEREREDWEPLLASLTVDFGTGPVPARFEICFDDVDSLTLLRVSLLAHGVDRRQILKSLETRWKTFLPLGVADTFARRGPSAYWEAVALDDGGCHALISWSETARGDIPGLSLSIVPGAPAWIKTTRKGDQILHEIHEEHRVSWQYTYCSERFSN